MDEGWPKHMLGLSVLWPAKTGLIITFVSSTLMREDKKKNKNKKKTTLWQARVVNKDLFGGGEREKDVSFYKRC